MKQEVNNPAEGLTEYSEVCPNKSLKVNNSPGWIMREPREPDSNSTDTVAAEQKGQMSFLLDADKTRANKGRCLRDFTTELVGVYQTLSADNYNDLFRPAGYQPPV